jgi:hypothetical protein
MSKIPFTIGKESEFNTSVENKNVQHSRVQVPTLSDFDDEPVTANTRDQKSHISHLLPGQENRSATKKVIGYFTSKINVH